MFKNSPHHLFLLGLLFLRRAVCFRKLDKPLQSLCRRGPCARASVRGSSPRASAFCFLGTAGKRSVLLCHPGTFKITVLYFNHNMPGGNTVLLDFLVLEVAGFLSLSLSNSLFVFLFIYCLSPSQMPFGNGIEEGG